MCEPLFFVTRFFVTRSPAKRPAPCGSGASPRPGPWRCAVLVALWVAFAGPAHAQQLPGRLFLTPAERAHLDELRAARPQQTESRAPSGTSQVTIDIPPPPPPEPFTMNGLVVRSSGPNTVWVDGQPVHSTHDTGKGVRIDTRGTTAGGTPVTVLESGRAVRLKPGQTYVPDGDLMTERYEEPPAPPPPR